MKPTPEETIKRFDEIGAELHAQKTATKPPVTEGNSEGRRLDVQAYCSHFGVELVKIKEEPGVCTIYCLKHCVFDKNHTSNKASIVQANNGALSYQCFHQSCEPHKWKAARRRISGDQKLDEWMVGGNDAGEKEKQADALIRIGKSAELFKAPDDTKWARFEAEGHFECWQIRSKGFRHWLVDRFYRETITAPSKNAVESALDLLEAQAQFASTREVYTRIAQLGEAIYLDMADDAWRAVRITPEGWSVVETPPVCFRRTRKMLPHPEPVRGGSLRLLNGLVNLGCEENWQLVCSFLSYCLTPSGPYPILCLISEQGSGKSVTARILRMLVDPSVASIRALPTSLEDLAVAGHHSWLLTFDNLSCISDQISDGLCRMSTGGGFGTRAHYTNDDEAVFWATRPIILNGISDFAKRSDLLDRSIILHLPMIPPEKRKTERQILDDFEKLRPLLLGALLDVAVLAIKNLPSTNLPESPRMADFAKWSAAAAPAFGTDPAQMGSLVIGKQDEALSSQLDDPLALAVFELLEAHGGIFEARPSDMLEELNDYAPESVTKGKKWPKSGRGLTSALRRLAPVLRLMQVNYQHLGHGRNGSGIRLEKRDDPMPKVMGRDGSVKKQRHGLTTQNQKESNTTQRNGDGCDDSTATFSPSFPLQEKKEEEDRGEKEQAATIPSQTSPAVPRDCPNLLEGEL
jgi:hypothetical protein